MNFLEIHNTYIKAQRKNKFLILFLGFILFISILLNIKFGSVYIDNKHLFSIFSYDKAAYNGNDVYLYILEMRISRTFCAFISGALLSLSGCLMQILLKNPLAEPYILGISGGAAVSNLFFIIVLGISYKYFSITSFIGSLISMLIVMIISNAMKNWTTYKVLLSGVAISSIWSAIIGFILSTSTNNNIKGVFFWFIGDLSNSSYSNLYMIILFLIVALCLFLSKELDIYKNSDILPLTLGINKRNLRIFLYISSSLLTATSVSISGCIGFIGLIVPHLLNLLGIKKCNLLFIGSILLGGSILIMADLFSRIIFPPIQLPVGIITNVIGALFFLFLISRRNTNE